MPVAPILKASLLGAWLIGSHCLTRDEVNLKLTHYSMNTAGIAYVGCFRDNGDNRDLPVFKEDTVDMTPTRCNDLCAGYDYFGVQITQCYCGNTYGSVQEPTVTEGQTANGKWTPGSASSTTPPVGVTSLENAMGQTAYETNTNTLGGIGIIDDANLNKYIQEGCYHDCGGATAMTDAGLPCGGLNRNSVYRRPSTMPSVCQSTGVNQGHPLMASRGICDPPQNALHTATMPPCVDSATASCMVEGLAHEDRSFSYSKPWETHHDFQSGHARDNALAREKESLLPPMNSDESYMVHS